MHTKRWLSLLLVVPFAALSLMLFATGCSDDKDEDANPTDTPVAVETMVETPMASTVTVNLTEWDVLPDTTTVAAGSVTFNAKNIGSEMHELVVLKTDLPADGLPTSADGSADEAGAGIVLIGEVEDLAAGGEGTLTANLEPGNYVLICNVVDTEMGHIHYPEGMRTAFTVTQ